MQVPETEVIVTGADGTELLRTVLIPGEYVIGRNTDCELPVVADLVSRKHALLTINFDHALIEDLGSSNGTFVNGQPVKECTRLWPNQKIQLGTATLELHRMKSVPPPDVSLAPTTAAVRRMLPKEFLGEKKYDIGGMVARGGMGAILDAKEAAIERRVAMKVMLDGYSPDDLTRFVAEAKITGQLEHPNIVPVHELGVDENDQVFYTMKFVGGITLRKVLDLMAAGTEATLRKYPLATLLTIFQKVCDALAFAHSKSVIHRDLKPENIMLGDFGEVLLMDWGLAKLLSRDNSASVPAADTLRSMVKTVPLAETDGSMTLDGSIMGTPQYMAPEQARGEVDALDARSDVYSLGAILFHLLYLRAPISGKTAQEVVAKVAEGRLEWPDARTNAMKLPHLPGGRVPDSLLAVCRKALSLNPAERYQSIAALQKDVAAYQAGFATGAENANFVKQFVLLIRRKKGIFATGFVAWLIITGLSVWFVINVTHAKQRAENERNVAAHERDRAEAALSALKANGPDMLALAASEAAAQRFESALKKVDAALGLDPNLTAAYWRRGWVLFAREKLPEALAALHLATEKDPANREYAATLPLVERMAAAPVERRYSFEIIKPLYDDLMSVGATGEATILLPHLKLANDARLVLVRERIERWLGKTSSIYTDSPSVSLLSGRLDVNLSSLHLSNLDPLRSLPIDQLHIGHNGLASLEPLRGVRLIELRAAGDDIQDLSPLHGMPLEDLDLVDNTKIKDLSPLRGMPLKSFQSIGAHQLSDISPLVGMPLKLLRLNGCPISDFNVLRGMPLEILEIPFTLFVDGRVLAGIPLTSADLSGTGFADTTTLIGLPLRTLAVNNCPIRDFTPLLQIPTLRSLVTTASLAKLVCLRTHPGLKQINSRPVAEVWAEYDAQQAAQKK